MHEKQWAIVVQDAGESCNMGEEYIPDFYAALTTQAGLEETGAPDALRPLWDAAEEHLLKRVSEDALPTAAIAALENGLDGRYLRMLAGWTPASSLEPLQLLEASLAEQGRSLPDYNAIVRKRLFQIATRLLDGRLHINRLADALVDGLGRTELGCGALAYLLWVYAADWWDNDERWWKNLFETLAREEAEKLLTQIVRTATDEDETTGTSQSQPPPTLSAVLKWSEHLMVDRFKILDVVALTTDLPNECCNAVKVSPVGRSESVTCFARLKGGDGAVDDEPKRA